MPSHTIVHLNEMIEIYLEETKKEWQKNSFSKSINLFEIIQYE